jgi:hypothetical protein
MVIFVKSLKLFHCFPGSQNIVPKYTKDAIDNGQDIGTQAGKVLTP